jgi:hypothetical protein
MSFLGATGSAGSQDHRPPSAPTSITLSRNIVNNGAEPSFTVNWTNSNFTAPKCNTASPKYYYSWTTDNSSGGTNAPALQGPVTFTIPANQVGKSVTPYMRYVDGCNQEVTGSGTAVVAMTRPGDPTNLVATGGVGTYTGSWTAPNNGGGALIYYYTLRYSSGSFYLSGSTTGTSFSLSGQNAANLYFEVYAENPFTRSLNTPQSAVVSITSAPPPPPPPPPYFPPFFGPSFGPYFCLQADSPVLVWVDGKTLQKKVKDIEVGDKIVSYTFAELPENDSEYSLNSWNSQSMTPLEAKEATVVRNEKLIAQSTVFFNGDINNRMSLEHLVFIERDGKYSIVLAGLVEPGDTVLKINEETLEIYESVIESVDHLNEQTEIYKLDVTPYDVFFGGNILTHNKGGFY